ncbi:hypothetical protein [European catfish virus]|uniref:Uncharacterized protein n=1 Tax=European catfish virus TaxID=84739 RepID=I2BFN3_9VIRU|nr:hypothetical protein A190_gp053 [European catfish virus]AFJ52336.1 hypothetical protein [European catfish virus]AMZ04882.1 hypothetical protein [European catfish virus]AMZ05018.1 hypothetical protein [European catfish virus]
MSLYLSSISTFLGQRLYLLKEYLTTSLVCKCRYISLLAQKFL